MEEKIIEFDYKQLTSTDQIDNIINDLISNQNNIKIKISKDIILSKRRFIINLYFLYILNKYNLPIDKKYLLLNMVTNKKIYQIFSNIYQDLITLYESKNNNDFYYDVYKNIRFDFWYCINWINNFAITYCKEYIESVDIYHLSKLYHHKEIKELRDTPLNKKLSISNIENQIAKVRNTLLDKLKILDVEENQLKNFIKLNLINKGQLSHLLYKIGYRTDVDDTTINKLIENNYIDGIKDTTDFVLEALADKKSRLYNKLLMPHCQYNNRKNQLMIYNISKVHNMDCGTKVLIEFLVTEKNCKGIIGKYISKSSLDKSTLNLIKKNKIKLSYVTKDLIEITQELLPYLIGKIIKMRSPLGCQYKDGVCVYCGGKLITYYIQREFNLGHACITEFFQRSSQKVLSNKHFQITTSREYILPEELKPILTQRIKRIYLRPEVKTDNLELGFKIDDARYLLNISDLVNINENEIFENNFGKYRYLTIRRINENEEIEYLTPEVSLKCFNYYPNLTKPFILFILENYKSFKYEQDMLWIPLKNFNKSKPIFDTDIVNYSIKVFYDKIDEFIQYKISKYNNASACLQDFSDIIYERSEINIVYLEVLLKAFLIRNRLDMTNEIISKNDYPVMFGNIDKILKQRHIGAALAYQEHYNFLRNPLFYLIPKNVCPFDVFLNYNL